MHIYAEFVGNRKQFWYWKHLCCSLFVVRVVLINQVCMAQQTVDVGKRTALAEMQSQNPLAIAPTTS